MTRFSAFRATVLAVAAAALGAAGVTGCNNSVDQDIPDAEATPAGWSLVWSDEFDGDALDLDKWSYQLGDGCAEGICGWGNGEFQNYTASPENISVGDGTLTITARQQVTGTDSSYTSARIRTLGKGDWTYGRFEVRAKLPTGQGLWPAIWLLFSEDTYGGWAASGEIDIMEAIGSEPGEVFGTLHYGGPFPDNAFSGAPLELAVDTFDQDFYMILIVAVGGNLPGAPDASTSFPQAMEVDYVRVYERTE